MLVITINHGDWSHVAPKLAIRNQLQLLLNLGFSWTHHHFPVVFRWCFRVGGATYTYSPSDLKIHESDGFPEETVGLPWRCTAFWYGGFLK